MKNIFSVILFSTLSLCVVQGATIQYFTQDSVSQELKDSTFQQPAVLSSGKEVLSGKNLAIFGTVLGGAFLLDNWLNKQMPKSECKFLNNYTDVTNNFGEKKIMIPVTLSVWALGKVCHDKRLSNTALNSGKALITGAILVESIKITAGRSRPDMNRGNMHFNAFNGNNNDTKSFPSGHAFLSWAVFTPFAQEYSKWFYAIPVSVSFARMYRNRHWFSDVVLGSGIGYFAGMFFHKRNDKKIIYTGNGVVFKF